MSTYYQLDYSKHELMMFIDSKHIRRVSYKGYIAFRCSCVKTI